MYGETRTKLQAKSIITRAMSRIRPDVCFEIVVIIIIIFGPRCPRTGGSILHDKKGLPAKIPMRRVAICTPWKKNPLRNVRGKTGTIRNEYLVDCERSE